MSRVTKRKIKNLNYIQQEILNEKIIDITLSSAYMVTFKVFLIHDAKWTLTMTEWSSCFEEKKSEKSPKSTGHARFVFIIERTPMLRPFKFSHKKQKFLSERKYNQYLITYVMLIEMQIWIVNFFHN